MGESVFKGKSIRQLSAPAETYAESKPLYSRKGRVIRGILVLVLAAAFMVSCSSSDVKSQRGTSQKPLLWPPPPEAARISYLQLIERPSDIGVKKGVFTRLVEFVVGAKLDEIVKPFGMAVDSSGRLLVADTAQKRVHIFDINKNKYKAIEDAGKQPLISPVGIAVDSDDNFYITDSMPGKVYVYNSDGKFVRGFNAGKRPTGIALNAKSGRLLVVDTPSHVVNVFNLEGKKLGSMGGWGNAPGQFNYPVDIFVDKKGDMYVVDSMNYKVQIFDKDGRYLTSFGKHGDGTGDFGRPKGVAVDSNGHIYITDALFDTVQIFSRKGEYLLSFGALGRQPGSFWLPTGLFIDDSDKIYVADSYNKRVQIFEYLGSDS